MEYRDRVLDGMIAALSDDDPCVRSGAADILKAMGSTRAVDSLISSLNDEDAKVRAKARLALVTITGVAFGMDSEVWFEWWNEHRDQHKEVGPD
ncbi:HEAT repeat domain-containing protein [Thermodesulfobacteriota bacterium]